MTMNDAYHEIAGAARWPQRSAALPGAMWRALSGGRALQRRATGLDAWWTRLERRVRAMAPRRWWCMRRAGRIESLRARWAVCDDAALRAAATSLRGALALGRERAEDVDAALALVGEVSKRRLGFYPHRVQYAAALAIEAGCVAELATGEGKTLVAALAATLAGWRGRGCHVVTANDYLAQRDAEAMAEVYAMCGVSVGVVQQSSTHDARRDAYAADVTYCTSQQAAADFLRDRLAMTQTDGLTETLLRRMVEGGEAPLAAQRDALSRLVMRGLHCAIVDEADAVLIDEAVTPLIISAEAPNAAQAEAYREAAEIAALLQPGADYTVDRRRRAVTLTEAGRDAADTWCDAMGGVWAGLRRRYELISQALSAREMFIQGRQYVVQNDRVVIVDEFTGRLMPDRSWQRGLHQAVEAKEGVAITGAKQTKARISFQRFFRLYDRLAGMTGTAWEARDELWQTYRLPVVRIATHRPCRRRQSADRVFADTDRRWAAVVAETRRLCEAGRAVLIGTRSVQASEALSAALRAAGLDHEVLNATRHAEEAAIIAHAGERGRITVATNMAGRGTDIKLDDAVKAAGGLAVIATERHESTRIDRQLFGRAGRQGDPGSAAAMISAGDELLMRHAPRWARWLLRWRARRARGASGWLAAWIIRIAQRRARRAAAAQREDVLRHDDWLDENLSFAGESR